MKPKYFKSYADFRRWLEKNHAGEDALTVGLYKKASGIPSVTYAEAVDAALCFGWIDGVRNSVDESRYCIRFTPRRGGSIWSKVNLKRIGELIEAGEVAAAGLAAFQNRDLTKQQKYSYENRPSELDAASLKKFRADKKAWKFFQSEAPWYRRTSSFWVMSAKKDETRQKRLAALIECSAQGKRIPQLSYKSK